MDASHFHPHADKGFSKLPSEATEASHLRYRAAQALVDMTPASFGQEAILSGSAARGVSDEVSDIEIVFYVESFPSRAEREEWLRRTGATDIVWGSEPERGDQTWAYFVFGQIWVEVGWQLLAAHEKQLAAVASGAVTAHGPLTLAWIIHHAVSLRSVGLLDRWRQRCAHYPEIPTQRILTEATHFWFFPHFFAVRWALIRRGEHLALVERLYQDTRNMLRILFAINHQWEPDWKWLGDEMDHLSVKPERLLERIDAIFLDPHLEQRVTLSMVLLQVVLLLVPARYEVTRVRANVHESLRLHG